MHGNILTVKNIPTLLKIGLPSSFYWKGIDRIYMMFDNHTRHALSHNIVKDCQITTQSRGTEVEWYQKYLIPQKTIFW